MYDMLASGDSIVPREKHSDQTWAPVGARVDINRIRRLIDAMTVVAEKYGFPEKASPKERVAFDRDAARVLRQHMDLSWAEAGNRDLWSFLSLVALPHVTMWRFGLDNKERWIASDLTRHAWARLWWQAVVFAGHEHMLDALSESDLNQLLERRSIGGDPRLVREMARVVTELDPDVPRRPAIRQVTYRLRRYLAFLDVRALSDEQVRDLCSQLMRETVMQLSASGEVPPEASADSD